jgi:hypothetical protein
MIDLERWIKRYLWDDERTPYLVRPAKLTRRQADYEIFAYCTLLGFLFGIVGLTSLDRPVVALYAALLLVAALACNTTKHPLAAWCCASAPLAAALYLASGSLPGPLGLADHVVLIALIVLWGAYGLRIVSIARAYADMPQG